MFSLSQLSNATAISRGYQCIPLEIHFLGFAHFLFDFLFLNVF